MPIPTPDAARVGDGTPIAESLASMTSSQFARVRWELAENPDHDLAVHQARKAMKRVRALLRLVRRSIGAVEFAVEDADARDIGRLLAPLRDARVTLDTIGVVHPGGCPVLASRLAERHQSLMDAAWVDDVVPSRVNAALEGIESRWAAIFRQVGGDGLEAVRTGMARTYRRGRKRMKRVIAQPGAEAFHEWRKEVKYLRYQLEAMSPADEVGLSTLVGALDELGETLGSEHDLTVLAHLATAEDGCGEELARLAGGVGLPGGELRARALTLGQRLYEPERQGLRAERSESSLAPGVGPASLEGAQG